MSASSDYQRLRSHLAFLRMAAAAEALPGVLEEATKAKLSHSAFLERLLGIEVEAVDERRRASLARFASLPSPFTLADFDFSAQPSVDRNLIAELGTLRFVEDATNAGSGTTTWSRPFPPCETTSGAASAPHHRRRRPSSGSAPGGTSSPDCGPGQPSFGATASTTGPTTSFAAFPRTVGTPSSPRTRPAVASGITERSFSGGVGAPTRRISGACAEGDRM